MIVENRAGAAGALGSKAVASAEADGYTLLCGNISSLVVLPAVGRVGTPGFAQVFDVL